MIFTPVGVWRCLHWARSWSLHCYIWMNESTCVAKPDLTSPGKMTRFYINSTWKSVIAGQMTLNTLVNNRTVLFLIIMGGFKRKMYSFTTILYRHSYLPSRQQCMKPWPISALFISYSLEGSSYQSHSMYIINTWFCMCALLINNNCVLN